MAILKITLTLVGIGLILWPVLRGPVSSWWAILVEGRKEEARLAIERKAKRAAHRAENMNRLVQQSYSSVESDPGIRRQRMMVLAEGYWQANEAQKCLSQHTYEGREPDRGLREYADHLLNEIHTRESSGGRK